jgi:hypothetical protein
MRMTKKQKVEQLKQIYEKALLMPNCPASTQTAIRKELAKLTRAPRTKVRTYSEKELRKAWVVRFKNAGYNYKIFIQELRKGKRA